MAITKPPVLPAWADAGDKVQPSNAELSVGWPVSSTPPSRQRFNWALNFVANAVRYFSRRGLVDYDVAETYMIGDRVIGDDGKTYKCLVDNTIAFTPSTNPAKWARWGFTLAELNSEVTTPTQFDNTTKVATTEFVKRQGLQVSSRPFITVNTTLTAAHAGAQIEFSGSPVFTLPLANSVSLGAIIRFHSDGTGVATVQRQGADQISPSSTIVTSFPIGAGDSCELVSDGFSTWGMFGGTAQLAYASAFGSSLSGLGYQKLPSGLIIQWGSVSNGSTAALLALTFPITFPNAGVALALTAWNSQGVTAVYTHNGRTTTGASIFRGGSASSYQYDFLAIGY